MCTVKPKFVQLPASHDLCSTQNSGCRDIEVKVGRKKWERRLAILARPDGDSELTLHIYLKPSYGQKFSLEKLKKMNITRKNDGQFTFTLIAEKQPKLEFRIDGTKGGIWLAALQGLVSDQTDPMMDLQHKTHGQKQEVVSTGTSFVDIKEEPDTNASTGSREGYQLPANDGSGSHNKKKNGRNNDKSGEKSVEKKKESVRNLKPVTSKTKTKQSTETESRKKKELALAKTQTEEEQLPKVDDPLPVQRTESDPDVKNTQETQEKSAKGIGMTPDRNQLTPTSAPGAGLTPTPTPTIIANEEKVKTMTNSDENDAPDKKK